MSALLRGSVTSLREMAAAGTLTSKLVQQMHYAGEFGASPNEIASWSSSFPVLLADLEDAGLGTVEVLFEYKLPYTSKRVDAVLCGSSPKTGKRSIVFVELKQWTQAKKTAVDPTMLEVGGLGRNLIHPLTQVSQYEKYARNFNGFLETQDLEVHSAAYLHNWTADQTALDGVSPTSTNHLFLGSTRGAWLEFLKSRFSGEAGAKVADELLSAKLRPSQQLLKEAAEEVKNREQFVLLDEQRVAYDLVMAAVKKATASNLKTAIIITGGPGSGKSVIALSLLGELMRQGRTALHATGSRSFRNSLQKIVGKGSSSAKNVFKYFNNFITAEPNSLDVIICDEAHRIRATSANRFTSAANRTGKSQADELLSVARVPVFLLDEFQVVRKGEVGTPEFIEDSARKLGLEVERVSLNGQFRCGGSGVYEHWLVAALGIEGKSTAWIPDGDFEIRVANGPEQLEDFLAKKNSEGYSARMSAGFCWAWHEPDKNGNIPLDVKIGNWHRPWNIKSDKSVGGFLSGDLWPIDPKGFEQLGCVYTAQGFEFDFHGVIIGPDLVWRSGEWVGVPAASADPAMRGIPADLFTPLVKNTYKVLLTRGLIGTVVFSTDPETQSYLEDLIKERV